MISTSKDADAICAFVSIRTPIDIIALALACTPEEARELAVEVGFAEDDINDDEKGKR